MRVCILGLGAVGGFVAARLAHAGIGVSALARGRTLQAIRAQGLRLESGGRTIDVPIEASDDARALGPQDFVILTVKTTALASVPAAIGPLLGERTAIVSAMNGVPWWFFHGLDAKWRTSRLESTDPGGALARAMPPGRVIGCVVHLSAAMPEPGHVRHAFGDRFIFGEPGGATTARLEAIAEAFRRAGLTVEITPRIEQEVWMKLWGNMTVNPISAFTRATGDRILDDPFIRRFASDCMIEARRVGERFGLPITMTPEERHAVTRKLGALRTSMLQDVENGRPIELDALVGAVSEMGDRVDVDTPNIDALLGLARLFGRVHGLYPG